MAAQRIIDLDVVVPDSIQVKIDDTLYRLPGDIPVPQYLRIAKLVDQVSGVGQEEGDSEGIVGALESLYDEVVDLLAEHNELPEDDEGRPSLPIGPARLGALAIQLYSADAPEAEEERPTQARKGGTKSSSRSKSKRSRSSK